MLHCHHGVTFSAVLLLLAGRFLDALEEPSPSDPSAPSSSPWARSRDGIPLGGHYFDGSRARGWS